MTAENRAALWAAIDRYVRLTRALVGPMVTSQDEARAVEEVETVVARVENEAVARALAPIQEALNMGDGVYRP
jgi:hypothetical protein